MGRSGRESVAHWRANGGASWLGCRRGARRGSGGVRGASRPPGDPISGKPAGRQLARPQQASKQGPGTTCVRRERGRRRRRGPSTERNAAAPAHAMTRHDTVRSRKALLVRSPSIGSSTCRRLVFYQPELCSVLDAAAERCSCRLQLTIINQCAAPLVAFHACNHARSSLSC